MFGINISLDERIARLEHHLNMQIDENRKVSRRIDELVAHLKEYHEIVLGACPIEIEKMCRKKPHKCPICDGYGIHENSHQCKSCQGRGIVWG